MVNGRLRCLGSSQHLKHRFGDGFEVNIKTRTPGEEDLVALSRPLVAAGSLQVPTAGQDLTLSQLDSTRVAKAQLPNLLIGLGIPCPTVGQLVTLPQDLSDLVDAEGGALPLRMLFEWAFAERAAAGLSTFLRELSGAAVGGGSSLLLERSTAHSFRFRLQMGGEAGKSVLAVIFRSFEASKERLCVQEYSVGQTTLEQIFNQFAASQDNPEVAAIARAEAALLNPLNTDSSKVAEV